MTRRRLVEAWMIGGWALGASLLALGCSSNAEPMTEPPPVIGDKDVPQISGWRCNGTKSLEALPERPKYAVISTDYMSTSIALLRADGSVLRPSWLNSGTASPGLVAALSGDVDLPGQQAPDGSLTLLDRFRNDVVSRFCLPGGELVGQVRVVTPVEGQVAFSGNPRDVIWTDPNSAWVTRYESNLDPQAPAENRGNDLLEIQPTTMQRTGRRIDLSSLNVEVNGVTVLARPNRVVRLGTRVVVGVDGISADFSTYAPGRIALVDLDSGSVEPFALPGLRNCNRLTSVPGAVDRLLVGCTGGPFSNAAEQRDTSGIVLLSVPGVGQPTIVAQWRVVDHPGAPRVVENVVSLGGSLVLAVASGSFNPVSGDTLYRVNLQDGSFETVLQSAGAFELGTASFDANSGLLLVPDATTGLRRLQVPASGAIQAIDTLAAPDQLLPVRQVYALR